MNAILYKIQNDIYYKDVQLNHTSIVAVLVLPTNISSRLRIISSDISDTFPVAPNFTENQTYFAFRLPNMHREMT
jgi:hypothetical protein